MTLMNQALYYRVTLLLLRTCHVAKMNDSHGDIESRLRSRSITHPAWAGSMTSLPSTAMATGMIGFYKENGL